MVALRENLKIIEKGLLSVDEIASALDTYMELTSKDEDSTISSLLSPHINGLWDVTAGETKEAIKETGKIIEQIQEKTNKLSNALDSALLALSAIESFCKMHDVFTGGGAVGDVDTLAGSHMLIQSQVEKARSELENAFGCNCDIRHQVEVKNTGGDVIYPKVYSR